MKFKKEFFIIALIILGFSMRFFLINVYPYKDEFDFINGLRIYFGGGEGLQFLPVHPPMWYLLFYPAYHLFDSFMGLRVLMIVSGVITLIFTYLIAKEIYDKRKAMLAVIILTFMFWFCVANTMIDIDSSILSMFLAITIYFIIKAEKTSKKAFILLAGIFFGFSMLTKYTAILLAPTILTYWLINQKIKSTLKNSILFFLSSVFIFGIFPLLSLIKNPILFNRTIFHGQEALSIIPNFKAFIFILIWGSCLMIILPLIYFDEIKKSIKNKSFLRKINLLYFFIFFIFIFGLFTRSDMALDRVYSIMLPGMAILISSYLLDNKQYIKRKLVAICSVFFIMLFYILSMLKSEFVTHAYSTYFAKMIHLEWNYLFPIRGSSGPMFLIPFSIIGISVILSILAILIFLSFHRTPAIKKIAFSFFIGLCIATNIYLISEYSLHLTTPDINKALQNMQKYIYENDLKIDMYSENMYIMKGPPFIIYKENELSENKKGTAVYLDFQKEDTNIKNCSTIKTFKSKDYIFGYIFNCTNINEVNKNKSAAN